MEELYAPFLAKLQKSVCILDAGCGTGRDTKTFLKSGYIVDAFDASIEMVKLAKELTNIPVKQQKFQDLDENEKYHGIWACSSILHVPKEELPDVFRRFHKALKQEGIIYTSFKFGDYNGVRNGRHFSDFTDESFKVFNNELGLFTIEKLWTSNDIRPGRENEKWLNLILSLCEVQS